MFLPRYLDRESLPRLRTQDVHHSLSHMRGATKQKKIPLTSGVIGLFTGPHQTSFSELDSLTIRLSSGERPVFAPENAVKAPVDVMAEPVS